jgi:hypothetical protein
LLYPSEFLSFCHSALYSLDNASIIKQVRGNGDGDVERCEKEHKEYVDGRQCNCSEVKGKVVPVLN